MTKAAMNPVLGPKRRLPRRKSATAPHKAKTAEGILATVSDGPNILNAAASDA